MNQHQHGLFSSVLLEALNAEWPFYGIVLTSELDTAFAGMLPTKEHRVAGSFDDTQSAINANSDRLIVAMIGRDLEPLHGLQIAEMITHAITTGSWRYIIAGIPQARIDGFIERVNSMGTTASADIVGMMLLWIQPEGK